MQTLYQLEVGDVFIIRGVRCTLAKSAVLRSDGQLHIDSGDTDALAVSHDGKFFSNLTGRQILGAIRRTHKFIDFIFPGDISYLEGETLLGAITSEAGAFLRLDVRPWLASLADDELRGLCASEMIDDDLNDMVKFYAVRNPRAERFCADAAIRATVSREEVLAWVRYNRSDILPEVETAP